MDAGRHELEDILNRGVCDFFSIDSQHAAFKEDRLVSFSAMAEELDVPVLFRIKHTRHAYLIGNYLDLGPTGIVVPQVEEESTVEEAVEAFYFPQVGKRSWGGDARRGIKICPDRIGYAAWWNGYGILCIQLESVDAIINARKLARPGVDMLTFGPNDLLYSIEGYHAPPFRDVDECIRHVVKEMEGTDVRISLGLLNPDDRNKYLDMGVTVFQ